ncbi:unnamed protein product [Trichobilharzia regenti]|nr:unnamed protein product [Trichobilharzia regenti]
MESILWLRRMCLAPQDQTMRPWLQEAISSTRMLESNYTVDGPLTWKAFHQLAGRGSDETCKPQPIPQLRVCGGDQDNLLISPFAVRDWDRLSLFPLSRAKRIAYAVVLPTDSHTLVSPTSNIQNNMISEGTGSNSASNLMRHSLAEFLKELSHTYQSCHLGQHFPYYMPEAGSPETAFIPVFPTPGKRLESNCSLLLCRYLVLNCCLLCSLFSVYVSAVSNVVCFTSYHFSTSSFVKT